MYELSIGTCCEKTKRAQEKHRKLKGGLDGLQWGGKNKNKKHSQVEHQDGAHHQHEATEGRVEVHDADQDGGARHGVHPVQPVAVLLVLVGGVRWPRGRLGSLRVVVVDVVDVVAVAILPRGLVGVRRPRWGLFPPVLLR